jgi:predicted GH43/DUF377 family glycosyl hydrolase
MKYITLIISSYLLILLFISCEQNQPTSPAIDDPQSGKLFLKIDSENAPESVVWIEAFLTRQGYDTISNTMNLLSDSTADLLLENIQAGEWHLQVDAKDSVEVVLYSGSTDVQIFAGFTTQVNLVLEPTGAGTGNVYIWVTWGSTLPGNWTDYTGNPIFSPSGVYWDYSGISQPKIIIIDNLYKMYFTAQGSPYSGYIGLAHSSDGISWTKTVSDPVLSPGEYGSWDETAVAAATVIKDEVEYKMYYHGWSIPDGPWHIGLATSPDGINWLKHPYPVLYALTGWEYQIGPSCIIKINGVYYLYYLGRNSPVVKVGLATSSDGINWTRHPTNPILIADQSWEGNGVYYANVFEQNDQFEMIYMNATGTGFGKATSPDGINWTKNSSNPFFTKDQTFNNWADYKIAYPFYIKIDNKDRVYYTGFPSSGPYKIGFVTK